MKILFWTSFVINRIILLVLEKIGENNKVDLAIGEGNYKECDVFSGRWVRDYSRPLYEEWQCPYIGDQLSCLKHGRPDMDYRYWRWQPHACYVPRYSNYLYFNCPY